MRVRAFITPKDHETFDDCQDRFSINPETGSLAVSDGMSQSLFPKYWAQLLAVRYTSEKGWQPTHDNVRQLAPLWRSMVDRKIDEMRSGGGNPWRTENMLADGFSAGATLVGLRLDGMSWVCDVLGDSCMVVLEDNKIKEIYSSMDISHFDNYPEYFDSHPERQGKGEPKSFSGVFEQSQTALLVSDAMGEFLSKIREDKNQTAYVRDLLNVESADEFEILVEWWRKNGMHNDDTTAVVVSFDDKEASEPFKRQEEWIW